MNTMKQAFAVREAAGCDTAIETASAHRIEVDEAWADAAAAHAAAKAAADNAAAAAAAADAQCASLRQGTTIREL